MNNSRQRVVFVTLVILLGVALAAPDARAENLIKRPGAHVGYSFEATPHLLAAPFESDPGFGVGFRGSFNIEDDGFIKKLNDSIGITVGGDYTNHGNVYLMGAMQWNFWFTEAWSAFGEPGLGFVFQDEGNNLHGVFAAGGRWQFSESASLTLRLGYPANAIGVSFFM